MDTSVILANLRRHWDDPGWWRDIAFPFVVRTGLIKPYFRYAHEGRGVRVLEEDWESLVILDACRYDMFAEYNTLEGDLKQRVSLGSNTEEFLTRNFGGGSYDDVVYVTANPQVEVRLDDPFHEVVSVWRDGWDEEHDTVLPETMAEATLRAAERYPDKRLVSHFVQPHYPFLGPTSERLFGDQGGIELSRRMATGEEAVSDHLNVWDMLQRGFVEERAVWDAYEETLQVTLPHVRRLVGDLDGRTVVTSDHGNLVGEYPSPCPVPMKMYGHPPGVYADPLVTVPWLVVEGESKRTVVEGTADSQGRGREGTDGARDPTDEATERLRDLGYLT
jgi:hypothetical protein